MQQLSGKPLDKLYNGCRIFHQKCNKIGFAFFCFFYDFYGIYKFQQIYFTI
jgi:hypothetical protein